MTVTNRSGMGHPLGAVLLRPYRTRDALRIQVRDRAEFSRSNVKPETNNSNGDLSEWPISKEKSS